LRHKKHSVSFIKVSLRTVDVSDRVDKNLVLCSINFTMGSFTNNIQFDSGFSEILKLKDDAVLAILDPMLHHTSVSNCFYYVITITLSVITDRFIYVEYLCVHL